MILATNHDREGVVNQSIRHPRQRPLPIGGPGDVVASVINQNIGAWTNGPSATRMGRQVVRWLCDVVCYGPDAGGNLGSGGMTASLTGLNLARDVASRNRAQTEGVTGRCAAQL